MKKKYVGITSELSLINGKVYEILGVSRGWAEEDCKCQNIRCKDFSD